MLIDFAKMDDCVMESFYGGEKQLMAKMYKDADNRILLGHLEPGASIGLHTHETSSEIIYILQGTGKVIYDDTEEPLAAGSCHYCPRGHMHSLINNSSADLVFFAVVPQQ